MTALKKERLPLSPLKRQLNGALLRRPGHKVRPSRHTYRLTRTRASCLELDGAHACLAKLSRNHHLLGVGDSTTLRCPGCGKRVTVTGTPVSTPFCSERCRLVDLGQWLSGAYRVPSEAPLDDLDALAELAAHSEDDPH